MKTRLSSSIEASDKPSSTMHSISWSGLKLGGTTLVLVIVSSRSQRKAAYYTGARIAWLNQKRNDRKKYAPTLGTTRVAGKRGVYLP